MNVGILALAAGKARRFGSDKRLARLPNGKYCIAAFLEQIEASGLPVLVCLAPGDEELGSMLDDRGCRHYTCTRAAEGMGGTLAQGITQAGDWDGVLIALADMPWIAPETYRTVARQLNSQSICVPEYLGQRGHPVGFGSHYYEEIAALSGDRGAREILTAYAGIIRPIPVADPAIKRDIDVPEDISAGDTSD